MFRCRLCDEYTLWRLPCEIGIKGKGYRFRLEGKGCDQDIKNKSLAITVAALGDSALQVYCSEMVIY